MKIPKKKKKKGVVGGYFNTNSESVVWRIMTLGGKAFLEVFIALIFGKEWNV